MLARGGAPQELLGDNFRTVNAFGDGVDLKFHFVSMIFKT